MFYVCTCTTFNDPFLTQEIGIAVELTTQHGGWFEFRICPNNDVTTPATHECLNNNLLPLADGTGSRIYLQIKGPIGFYNTTLLLPMGLSCTQCVLQWKWHTGECVMRHKTVFCVFVIRDKTRERERERERSWDIAK